MSKQRQRASVGFKSLPIFFKPPKSALTISSALITISTRASLKRYHTYTLTLGLSPEQSSDLESSSEGPGLVGDSYTYRFQRIGTAAEKQSVEKELTELRERLSKVEEWTERRNEIAAELSHVFTSKGNILPPPPYTDGTEDGSKSEGHVEE